MSATLKLEFIILVLIFITIVSVFITELIRTKKVKKVGKVDLSNVIAFRKKSRVAELEENLELFLRAEEALADDQDSKYMSLRMQALEAARRNLSSLDKSKTEKAS